MEFDKLDFVKTANPQLKAYDLEITDPKTGHFMVTDKAMLEFQLDVNGFTQINDVDTVYLGITDSDKSVFFKTTAKGETKFRKFKNINLMTKLNQINLVYGGINKGDKFVLKFVEDYNHYKMFTLEPFLESSKDASEATTAKEEVKIVDQEPIVEKIKEPAKDLPSVDTAPSPEKEEELDLY